MNEICLDTSVLSIFFSENPTKEVKGLMGKLQNGSIEAFLPKPVLIEAFYHVCKDDGKDIAKIVLVNFLKKYPITLVEFDESLIASAGQLKCQHSNVLSYIDCMGIAIALNRKIPFHTTEKKFKKIPRKILGRLKIVSYSF